MGISKDVKPYTVVLFSDDGPYEGPGRVDIFYVRASNISDAAQAAGSKWGDDHSSLNLNTVAIFEGWQPNLLDAGTERVVRLSDSEVIIGGVLYRKEG